MADTAPSTIQTKSNAMDVGYPSNYERLAHWFSKGFEPPQAVSMSDGDMLAAMKREYDATEYVACPHTSVGFAAADRLIPSEQHMVLATAHPSKFPATIIEGLGTWPQSESRMDNLPVPDSVETIQPSYSALEDAITLWFNS